MTAIADLKTFTTYPPQHLLLDEVPWTFYETILSELEERPSLQVTFDKGSIEIMSPLPEHDIVGRLLGQLLFLISIEREVEILPFGSTTFRDEEKQKGLEPDECYYIQNVDAARKIGRRFVAGLNPPPDLAIEIDVTHRSLPREPIYAELGVPELWRVRSSVIQCRHLNAASIYQDAERSLALPFLRPGDLWEWVERLRGEGTLKVIPQFKDWVRRLP